MCPEVVVCFGVFCFMSSTSTKSPAVFDRLPEVLADLARVRAGIRAHLTPSRAQPRDPSELAGDYRTERATEPLPATTAEGKP